jgi:hypothetical protein
MYEVIDIRCPVGAKNLLLKVRMSQESMEVNREYGVFEISCRDCTRSQRKEMADAGLPTKFRVIHRFYPDGVLCETVREVL